MELLEALQISFMSAPTENPKLSNDKSDRAIEQDLTNMDAIGGFSILDEIESKNQRGGDIFGTNNDKTIESTLKNQSDLINEYRRVSRLPEVNDAIDEITNEAVFEPSSTEVVTLDFDEGISDNLKKQCIDNFYTVTKLLNLTYNADMLFRRWYIDGRLALNLVYDNSNIRKGIQKINLMSPFGLYFDTIENLWKYNDNFAEYIDTFANDVSYSNNDNNIRAYQTLEIAYVDSGVYERDVILSNLHSIIKISNQLQTLEDLLIPLRFSRSISRRVFNIDVGDLPFAKGLQAVKKIRDNFKYKKYYDVANGRISNSSTVASIVEDYFLPKRSEGKGSNIDVLEETGNLGETGDIEYFQKKLLKSLKVPLSRASAEGGGTFDFTGTQIENEEKKFFAFIHRLRNRFGLILKEILKYQLISTNTMNEYEWKHYESKIHISWVKKSNYLERQHIELFRNKMDLYGQVSDHIGELYSKTWVLKNVLGFTDQEILDMEESLEIEAEKEAEKEINKAANSKKEKEVNIDNVFDEDDDGEDGEDNEDGGGSEEQYDGNDGNNEDDNNDNNDDNDSTGSQDYQVLDDGTVADSNNTKDLKESKESEESKEKDKMMLEDYSDIEAVEHTNLPKLSEAKVNNGFIISL